MPSFPLEAPTILPAAPEQPNSALVTTTLTNYQVSLYDCPSALPVDNPGIGTGTCGAMDSVYGSFGGREFATPSAAEAAVAAPAAPATPCQEVATVSVGSGTVATVFAVPGSSLACRVTWHKGSWTFVLGGAPTVSPIGSSSVSSASPPPPSGGTPWGSMAVRLLAQLSATPLPDVPGLVHVDVAPDGMHTEVRWAVGRVVYSVGIYHGAVPAIELASSMSTGAP